MSECDNGRPAFRLVAPDGTQRGDRIPGSRCFRDFCAGCLTPMRVAKQRVEKNVQSFCEECSPPRAKTLVGNCHYLPDEDAFRLARDQ